jgi:hypothetical protein
MRDFQTKLGVDDVTWNFIYVHLVLSIASFYLMFMVLKIYTCDALATARPDYDCNRKAQKLAKFAKAYNVVRPLCRCPLCCR